MQLALYCPNSGYYEQTERRIGRTGDFFTSVSVGPLVRLKVSDTITVNVTIRLTSS